jgi:hypothetical protein
LFRKKSAAVPDFIHYRRPKIVKNYSGSSTTAWVLDNPENADAVLHTTEYPFLNSIQYQNNKLPPARGNFGGFPEAIPEI